MRYVENRLREDESFVEKIKLASQIECINLNYEDSNNREAMDSFILAIKNVFRGERRYE